MYKRLRSFEAVLLLQDSKTSSIKVKTKIMSIFVELCLFSNIIWQSLGGMSVISKSI